jgi:hypothetical protein
LHTYCGSHPPKVVLHVDHMLAVANGGGNDMDNLITACSGCNLGKAAVPLSAVPQSMKERAAEVAEREKQLSGYQAIFEARRQRLEDETWSVLKILRGAFCDSVPMDVLLSVKRFVEALGVHETTDAAQIAVGAVAARRVRYDDKFRYFCGVCWGRIRDQAAEA